MYQSNPLHSQVIDVTQSSPLNFNPNTPSTPITSNNNKQLILLINASSFGENKITLKLMDDFLKAFYRRFSIEPEHKNIEYSMVLYRGYPNGSPLSIECSDRTTDFKFFLHWIGQIKYEGGGRRYHALAEGLYCALQFCNDVTDNNIVVVTNSDYSPLQCISNTSPNYNVSSIIREMVSRNIKVSLLCSRHIESLHKLWMGCIPSDQLKIKITSSMIIYHGMDEIKEITKNLRWNASSLGQQTTTVQLKLVRLLNGVVYNPQSWPNDIPILRYGTVTEMKLSNQRIKTSFSEIKLEKVNEDNSYQLFVDFLSGKSTQNQQRLGIAEIQSGSGLIIYASKGELEALYYSKPPRKVQTQNTYQQPMQGY